MKVSLSRRKIAKIVSVLIVIALILAAIFIGYAGFIHKCENECFIVNKDLENFITNSGGTRDKETDVKFNFAFQARLLEYQYQDGKFTLKLRNPEYPLVLESNIKDLNLSFADSVVTTADGGSIFTIIENKAEYKVDVSYSYSGNWDIDRIVYSARNILGNQKVDLTDKFVLESVKVEKTANLKADLSDLSSISQRIDDSVITLVETNGASLSDYSSLFFTKGEYTCNYCSAQCTLTDNSISWARDWVYLAISDLINFKNSGKQEYKDRADLVIKSLYAKYSDVGADGQKKLRISDVRGNNAYCLPYLILKDSGNSSDLSTKYAEAFELSKKICYESYDEASFKKNCIAEKSCEVLPTDSGFYDLFSKVIDDKTYFLSQAISPAFEGKYGAQFFPADLYVVGYETKSEFLVNYANYALLRNIQYLRDKCVQTTWGASMGKDTYLATLEALFVKQKYIPDSEKQKFVGVIDKYLAMCDKTNLDETIYTSKDTSTDSMTDFIKYNLADRMELYYLTNEIKPSKTSFDSVINTSLENSFAEISISGKKYSFFRGLESSEEKSCVIGKVDLAENVKTALYLLMYSSKK